MDTQELSRLIGRIDPARTVLLLGAGATKPSGAPLAIELCRYLEEVLADGERISDDLAELSNILEYRISRRSVVDTIVTRLRDLMPDTALVALARYPWPSIYTTNYDTLIEKSFQQAGNALAVVRSHFDWEAVHRPGVTALFKLHGCITQDRAYGHRASMIITADDYLESEAYRQLLFGRLKIELAGANAIIVGHSLKDPDVQALVVEALRLQREAGAPGRIHVLVYESDEERAGILLRRGVHSVIHGDINSFVYAVASNENLGRRAGASGDTRVPLPPRLEPSTIDVASAAGPGNPRRLFYGGAAQYEDIRAGYTFERDLENELRANVNLATVVTGVAGTGKTTLARRLVSDYLAEGQYLAFEHRPEFPLDPDEWLAFERRLATGGSKAILLIDNCIAFQGQVNNLVRRLPNDSCLHIIVTAETSVWKIRQKDPRLFSHAKTGKLSQLSGAEIRRLRRLVVDNPALRVMTESWFLHEPPAEQLRILERRCSADMFVCLKVLFSSDSIDDIILREYNELDETMQNVYRVTAGLEAAGAIPHRQMVLRVGGILASMTAGALDVLEGLVEEQERQAALGIYVWHTRHEIIAKIISEYKYSDPQELYALLSAAIETANPTYFEELRSLREMCNAERGIEGLPDAPDRIKLYRKIIEVAPNERVPRHRLIAELIRVARLGDAEAELKTAIDEVRLDSPLQRYRVRLQIARSRAEGLSESDRKAILKIAISEAERGMQQFPMSKYMYYAAADVAEEWFYLTGERGLLEWARLALEKAERELLDPDIGDRLLRLARC